jgi:glycosyltransferase involved in cell wall biosynthesis
MHYQNKQRNNEMPRGMIIAAIPAYNEENFIVEMITKSKKYVDEVIVINDGSTDRTAEFAQAAGARVISHKEKRGAGAATRSAFKAVQTSSVDILVTLDGDGQHNPDEIPQILAPILKGEADLVIGSRFIPQTQQTNGTNIRRYRKLGIDIITWLYNIGAKVKVFDSQCCFRAHSRRLIEAMDVTEDGFGFSVQILIQSRKKGFTIKEVPISCIYHSQGSSLNPVAHGFSVALAVVKLRLRSLVATRSIYT